MLVHVVVFKQKMMHVIYLGLENSSRKNMEERAQSRGSRGRGRSVRYGGWGNGSGGEDSGHSWSGTVLRTPRTEKDGLPVFSFLCIIQAGMQPGQVGDHTLCATCNIVSSHCQKSTHDGEPGHAVNEKVLK